ncbi:MAG: cadmium-translocating P-type ATPase [Gemmatimonadetes bacterium SCN 70-22]|nr:MAG: cadmium-translocating P-type ATPase [Gemmatimonadetes bacterium SCN 70-22]
MNRSTRLDLPLLLPDVTDARDACVARLMHLLEKRSDIVSVHLVQPGDALPDDEPPLEELRPAANTTPNGASGAQLCLHYDAERLSLAQIEKLARLAGAQLTDRFAHEVIPIHLVGAEDEGRRIEASLRRLPGVTTAAVSLAGQVARVEYDRRRISLATIHAELAALGAQERRAPTAAATGAGNGVTSGAAMPSVPLPSRDAREAENANVSAKGRIEGPEPDVSWYARNRELAWSLMAGTMLAAGWGLERAGVAPMASIAAFVGAYIFGARDNVAHFLRDLGKGRFNFNIDLLMVVAALGAAVLGEWFEGALLLFLFSLGHALEHYALGRARNAIKALAELAPTRAVVLRDEGGVAREVTVAIEEVRPGDRVVVKPAERIPVDGTVTEGRSGVNQAPITGESVPVEKVPGESVFAGSVNGEGVLVVNVTAALGDRTLDRVVKLVAEAQTQKAPTQQFTDRFERIFVPVVLVADLLLIVVPPLLGVWTWGEAFYRAMALLVAASPCALALGTPSAVLAGIAQAARRGVLIKGGAHLEALGAIRVLALDKTGTITKGEPAVTDIVPAAGIGADDLLATTAAVERRSQHPLARAIMAAAATKGLAIAEAGEVQSVTGRGIRASVGADTVDVGRLLMFEERGMLVPEAIRADVVRLEANGRSTMVVRRSTDDQTDGWLGVIGIADEPRANAAATIERLRKSGITRIVMLTGDNAGVGNAVGRAVGVDEVRAGLLPEDKVEAIRELVATGPVAMIGDGVNDAPALANATVGIAMGGAGTAAALETADVALMSDDLGQLPFAIGLSHRARAIIRQNLYVSLSVIAGLIVVTVTGVAGIGTAVIVHEGSTLVVVANALRLLAYRGVD